MNRNNAQEKFNQLRRQAEELLESRGFNKTSVEFKDPLKLIHELQTFQIELELQNEELIRSQQELMKSQTEYTQLYDFSPAGYVSLNLKGLVLNANLTLADMLLTERGSLMSQSLSAHIVFEDQDIFYRHLQELFKSKDRQLCELRMKKKDGQFFDVQLESIALLDENEKHVQYRTVVTDICARKQAEEKLQQFKSIVSNSTDLMALIDADFIFLAVNNAYLKAWAKTADEVIGHSVDEFFDEDTFKKLIRPNAEKSMAGKDVHFSEWIEFDSGNSRYMDVQYSPYISPDKKTRGFVVNARDITAIKQYEVLLEHSWLQLETILNNINSSIYITDLKSNKVLFVNKFLKQHYEEDLIGKVCWQSLNENQDGPCEFCTKWKLMEADGNISEPFVSEIYNQKRNKWYELNNSAIPWVDGNLVHLGISTDITERKELEQKQKRIKFILEEKVRKRTAELEDMNAALKVLLKKREEDRNEIEAKIFANYKFSISPLIDNLRKKSSQASDRDMISILESELKNIISPFSRVLSNQMVNLTPMEIHIANFIKLGKSNKEISALLNSSVHTIARHRENIRRKTGLKNKKTNLRSFLLTLQ